MNSKFLLALSFALFVSPTFANDSNEVRESLGGYPLCEASAAIVLDCPEKKDNDKKKRCLLVGDNEIRDRLFLFEIRTDESRATLDDRREIYLSPLSKGDDFEISDIEALSQLPASEILVYGSHSRNKRCKGRKDRRWFAHGRLKKTRIVEGARAPERSKRHSCKRLFGDAQDALTQQLCATITRTERAADKVEDSSASDAEKEMACGMDPAFNLEGVVAVPGANGESRFWIGLRAPLLNDRAVLLRQTEGLKKFEFDSIVLLDLKGNGIRDMVFDDGKVWGIAGPAPDAQKPHKLWHLNAEDLKHGAEIQPTVVDTLPSYSEGLAIMDDKAFVLIDGSDPGDKSPMVCETPSEYIVLDLPN